MNLISTLHLTSHVFYNLVNMIGPQNISKYLINILNMFYWVLRYSGYKNSIKGKGKATWRKSWKRATRLKTTKETWERGSLMCSDKGFYCICSYTWYITNLYVDVSKLPNHLKLCGLYLFALDQFLLYFIIQTVSNRLRLMMLQSFFAVLLLLQKLFLLLDMLISLPMECFVHFILEIEILTLGQSKLALR